jgi:peptidoglycan/LPS O-acetylase OafA/YrhL
VQSQEPPLKSTIQNVQIMRFVAAGMVLVSHVQHEFSNEPALAGTPFHPFNPVFWAGGVDIFFIISGFIMYYISHEAFGRAGASKAFAYRRFLRVVPMYWFFTTAMIATTILFPQDLAHPKTSLMHILASYAFIPWPNAYGGDLPVLILGWTLNFEIFFYFVFALALFFSKRAGISLIFSILILLSALGVALSAAGWNIPIFRFWARPIAIEFLFGIVLAHLRISGLRLNTATAAVLVGTGILAMIAMESLQIAFEDNWIWRPLWMGVPGLLVCAGAALMPEAEEPSRYKRLLVLGGDLSFALYLSHPFAIKLSAVAMQKFDIHNAATFIVIASASAISLAALVHFTLEQPLLEFLRTKGPRKSRSSAVA